MRDLIGTGVKYLQRYRFLVSGVLLGVLAIGALGTTYMHTQRAFALILPDRTRVVVNASIQFHFRQDIAPHFKAQVVPSVRGTWKQTTNWLGVDSLIFTPKPQLETGQHYTLQLTDLKRSLTGMPIPNQTFTFVSEAAPGIASFTPKDASTNVPVDSLFSLRLKSDNNGIYAPQISLTPDVPMKLVDHTDTTFSWQPVSPLAQGTTYHVLIRDTATNSSHPPVLVDEALTTVPAPSVTSATTGGYFYPGTDIKVVFASAMKTTPSALQFNMPGTGSWLDAQTYKFTPTNLQPGTSYTYVLLKGATSVAGGVVEANQTFQISTPGPTGVIGRSPSGSGVGLNANVSFTFDQPVDHNSAQSKFSINPSVAGNFTWSGNTMSFSPQGYDYQTTYTASVAPGVVSTYGLPSTQSFSTQFTTVIQIIKLNVPIYKQAYVESCESSALRMALAYRGIMTDDFGILQRLNYNPRPRDTASNTWDDPYNMFVGDVNGAQDSTGYGVYSGPIALAAQSFGRNATAYTGVSASFITSMIEAGNPVLVWGYSSVAKPDSWNLPSGGTVQAWIGEHTRTVIGVEGNANDPIGFYVNDPATGTQSFWSTSQLMNNMNVLGNLSNQAVVVY